MVLESKIIVYWTFWYQTQLILSASKSWKFTISLTAWHVTQLILKEILLFRGPEATNLETNLAQMPIWMIQAWLQIKSAMSRLVVGMKTGRSAKSHIAIRANVAGSHWLSSSWTHFASAFHSSPFLVHWEHLREVPFHKSLDNWFGGLPSTFPSCGKVTNQVLH